MKKAIFAGSFNPIHTGHIKVIKKAAELFDKLYVVVANNDFKSLQGDPINRIEFVKHELAGVDVEVVSIDGKYLSTFAMENGINYLVRSARDNTDFDYELDMAKLNKKMNNSLETILIIPDYDDIEYKSTNFRDYNIESGK